MGDVGACSTAGGTVREPSGRGPWRVALAAAAALFMVHLFAVLLVDDLDLLRKVDYWVGAVASCAAAAAMLACAGRMRRLSRRPAGAWLLLGAGYSAFGAGELWTALGGGYGQGAVSYVLMFLYLAFYPLFFLGVLRLPKAPLSRGERLRLASDIALVVLAAGVFLWVFLIRPALGRGSLDPLKVFTSVAFPLGDLALLWALLALLYSRKERASGVYGLLAASTALLILTDTLLSFNLSGKIGPLPWVDYGLGLGWTLSYALSALAAVRQMSVLGDTGADADHGGDRVRPSSNSFYLAYLCLGAVLAALVLRYSEVFSPVTAAALCLMLLLVFVRQAMGISENERLTRRLQAARDDLERRVRERTNELKRAVGELETEVEERTRAERALAASEERFRSLVQNSNDIITIHDADGVVLYESPSLARILRYSPGALTGRNPLEFVHPEDASLVRSALQRVAEGTNTGVPTEFRFQRGDGSWAYLESVGSNLTDHPAVGGNVLTSREVTDRKQAEQRILHHVQRLEGLRAIDSAITTSLDLHASLSTILEQVTQQLGVDAAAVLLLDADGQTLAYAAGRGFRTAALHHTRLPMGECYAGRAAMERRLLQVDDLAAEPSGFTRSELLMSEGFHAYFAAPLVARGQVKGVFEVFHRGILDPDEEWRDYLLTLAGQAAIAVDNMTLFQNLQRTNVELGLAYETTLEGWSRALELRDRETQGHTTRVTDMTLRLARAVGMEEQAMAHVRRGALLHDIGKMGIPDSILLKPGPLTEEEWAVMRKHTEFAFALLWPVAYLRPALDIPYCHHEHWDGSGYPRGLKGEEIPLSARVFAVVDNWDALSCDRPYRAAWPAERVRAYLREKAGTLLDPAIVKVFLEIAPGRS